MKKFLFLAFFATFWFSHAQSQTSSLGDWELMCWDSANVTVPVLSRVNTSNSSGSLTRIYYRLSPSLAKVVPTVGTVDFCGKNEQDSLIAQLTSVINLLGGPGTCQVQNEYREETLTSTQTYATNTLHSIAIEAVSGTVTISTDAAPAVTLAVGDVHRASAGACRYIQSSITITITAGSANVSRIY